MEKFRDATLVFLVKKNKGEITDLCLAMKKRGFGAGRWNGAGGKVEAGKETVEEAARRETQEEIGVSVRELSKMAELTFRFPHNPAWDQLVHVYFAENWEGDLKESEEMRPRWFAVKDIPFSEMWPDDIFWLQQALQGRRLRASFRFGEKDVILEKEVALADELGE